MFLDRRTEHTTSAVTRDVYRIAAFHFSLSDSARTEKLLDELSEESPVWKIGYYWTRSFLNAIPDQRVAAALAEKIVEAQRDAGLKSGYLLFALDVYPIIDKENFERLYNDMMKAFRGYPEFLEFIARRNPVDRKISVGKPIPDFQFVSMDDSSHIISNETLKGQTYVIDLWATWCAPCVAELKDLHTAYEKFHHSGFTILSISFDEEPEAVMRFRNKKWTMPWHHVFAGQ